MTRMGCIITSSVALMNIMKLLVLSIAMILVGTVPMPGQSSAEDLNRQGIALARKGKLEEAILLFTKAIELDAKYDEPYYNRGKAKLNLKQLRAAIKDFDLAVELRPNYADAYNNRGIAKKKHGDLNGAITDYRLALRYDPEQYPIYFNRGVVRFDKGDKKGACADFTIAAKNNVPQSADALRKAGCE